MEVRVWTGRLKLRASIFSSSKKIDIETGRRAASTFSTQQRRKSCRVDISLRIHTGKDDSPKKTKHNRVNKFTFRIFDHVTFPGIDQETILDYFERQHLKNAFISTFLHRTQFFFNRKDSGLPRSGISGLTNSFPAESLFWSFILLHPFSPSVSW